MVERKYRYIGKSTPRKDAVDIVTGRAQYVGDIKQAGMLYGKVLRSPHAHANIKSIDTSRALRLRGVEAVLTYKDLPDYRTGSPRHQRVLDSRLRFVGDAVALVAARTEDIALQALDLIDVEYEVLPAVFDVEEALKPGAPQLYEQFPGNVVEPGYHSFGPHSLKEIVLGDVEAGFAEAEVVAEGTYSYENIPNPLSPEPPAVIAAWDGPDVVSVWLSSQGTYVDRVSLNGILGKKVTVRAYGMQTGGSFGTKVMAARLTMHAILLARAAGKPVKLCFTKAEQLTAFAIRLGSRIHGKVGMKRDGTVTAVAGEWLINTGDHSETSQAQVAVGCGEVQLMLRCPNWDLRTKIVCTNRVASGIVRGFGGLELKSAFLPILTLAMEKADLDPLEFFKKNYVKAGDQFIWRDGNRYVCRGVDYSKAMEKGAEAFGWREKWKGWLKPTAIKGNKRTGVGVGVHGNADVGEDSSEAYVRLDPDGSALVYLSICEPGTGQKSNLCKMAAEVLQLPLERVRLAPTDAQINPFEFTAVGSRGTYAIGTAVINASEDARRKLLELAALRLQVAAEDLDTVDGTIFTKAQPDTRIPWKAATGFDHTCLGYGRFDQDFTLPNCLMVFLEVEVDTTTGKVDLTSVVTATDVGQIIDPLCLENQLNGCLGSAGIDSAIFEETVLDTTTGRILNPNMIDYKWRTFAELPAMQHAVLETPFPSHRFGAIGVGEISPAPGPAAVLMAVSNAIGTRLHEYPVTPDKVLKALSQVQGQAKEGRL